MAKKERDPINIKKRVTKKQLDKYMEHALSLWNAWLKSISPENPEGNKKYLQGIEGIVLDADRPLEFKYKNQEGIEVPMLFLPPRLQTATRRVLMNRLDLK